MMIWNSLEKHKDIGILIIRLFIGLTFVWIHGWKKITGGPETWEKIGGAAGNFGITFLPVFWGFMASFAEAVGGLLIMLGLFFRPATVLITLTMFVAASSHIFNEDPINRVIYPLQLASVMIGLFFIGPGRYSLDALFTRKKEESVYPV
jgi:putative oxidoreductase